jgi:choline-glycine betaine transporter
VTIGCGQHSGTAQAIIILVAEVVSALVTSVWLPWGAGAGMGLISFLFCVARIVVAVLLVILTPTVSLLVSVQSNAKSSLSRFQLAQAQAVG